MVLARAMDQHHNGSLRRRDPANAGAAAVEKDQRSGEHLAGGHHWHRWSVKPDGTYRYVLLLRADE